MAEVDPKGAIFVGKGETTALLSLAFSNRHGLVTGATGTGKTVTLQVLAEGFSRAGVPVFAADIKGDLSGICRRGEAKEALVTRAKGLGFDYQPDEFPGHVLGRVRRSRAIRFARRSRDGTAAAVADDGSQRHAGRRAQHRLPRRRRAGAAAARSQGPARDPRQSGGERRRVAPRNTATCRRRPSARSSANCWCWKTRAAPSSSASRRWRWRISCGPAATAAATSTSSRPTS